MEGSPDLSWIANNTSKLSSTSPHKDDFECWTAISTRSFGTRHKVMSFLNTNRQPELSHSVCSKFWNSFPLFDEFKSKYGCVGTTRICSKKERSRGEGADDESL